MICPSCHGPNDPDARYCAHCRAPLDMGLMLDPMGQIQADGFAWRQATSGRPSLIVVIGIWFMFLPIFLGSATIILLEFLSSHKFSGVDILRHWVPITFAVTSPVMLYKATKNYFQKKKAVDDD